MCLCYDTIFQSVSATRISVTENQIKCDLLRTMPNNERFRSADCDGVRLYFALRCGPLIYLDVDSSDNFQLERKYRKNGGSDVFWPGIVFQKYCKKCLPSSPF